MWTADKWRDYELLDMGNGEKLERWGRNILIRPEPQAIWPQYAPREWNAAHAKFINTGGGSGKWEFIKNIPARWQISYGDLQFHIEPAKFKHTGLFPEQAVNWDWMRLLIGQAGRNISVLNLFGYTGGATMACAKSGATVCHVDASKGVIARARDNHVLCGLPATSVRWINDDVMKFISREIKRGKKYDAILMDPPSYGRGTNREVWKFEDEIYNLIEQTSQLLSNKPLFYIVNSYTTGFSPFSLKNMIDKLIGQRFGGKCSAGELGIISTHGGVLPCGGCARWQNG